MYSTPLAVCTVEATRTFAVIGTGRPGGPRFALDSAKIVPWRVRQNSEPSVQIQCRMMARFRATAILAFFGPTRLLSLWPHALSGDHRLTRVIRTLAAS